MDEGSEYLVSLNNNAILKLRNKPPHILFGTLIHINTANQECSGPTQFSCVEDEEFLMYTAEPGSLIKTLIAKRLFDLCTHMKRIYILICLKSAKQVEKYVLFSLHPFNFSTTPARVHLDEETELEVPPKTEVILSEGPTLCWKYEDSLNIHNLHSPDTTVKLELKGFLSWFCSANIQKSELCRYFVRNHFFFRDLVRKTCQIQVTSFDDGSVSTISKDDAIPPVYVEIMTFIQPISILTSKLMIAPETLSNAGAISSFDVICTRNDKCVMFKNNSVISFCKIPFTNVSNIYLFHATSLILYILLQSSGNDICALKYSQQTQKLSIERQWKNIKTVISGNFFLDGYDRLVFLNNDDLHFNRILVTDFTEYLTNEKTAHEAQHTDDPDSAESINSAIKSIQAKTLEMQMLEGDVEHELIQKKTLKSIIENRITALKSSSSAIPSSQDCSLVHLVGGDKAQHFQQLATAMKTEQNGLDLHISETSWKVIQLSSSSLIAAFDAENISKWIVDDIEITSSGFQKQLKCTHRLIKLGVERDENTCKRRKFKDSKHLLAPGQRGKFGLKLELPVNDNLDLTMPVLVHVSWTANGIQQSSDLTFNIDFSDLDSPHVMNEIPIQDLMVANAFLIKTPVSLISIYSNLNNIYQVISNCSTFKFASRMNKKILFAPLHDQFATIWICFTESHQAKLDLYTSCMKDAILFVLKLYKDPKFPTDILLLPNVPDTKYLKQKILLDLKSELNYILDNLKENDNVSSEVCSTPSPANIGTYDALRQSFCAAQQSLAEDIKFNLSEYEQFLAGFRKVQIVTDCDVANLCDIESNL